MHCKLSEETRFIIRVYDVKENDGHSLYV